jgi:hypothetical protein
MHSSKKVPIGFGAQGEYGTIIPGAPVCLRKPFIYCFKDAVINTVRRKSDPVTGKETMEPERYERFNVQERKYFVCDRACKDIPDDCTGIPLSFEDFYSDAVTADTIAEDHKRKMRRAKRDEKVEEDLKEATEGV